MRTITWCENLEAPLPIVSPSANHSCFWVCLILSGAVSWKHSHLSSKHVLAMYQAKIMWTFCVCPSQCGTRMDKAPSHIISDLRPWLKPLGWRTVDPGFVSRYKAVACFLQWAAGADICALPHLSRIYCTQGLSTSTPTWSCGAGWSDSLDRWMDVHEKLYFFPKKIFWFGWVQAGRAFPFFGRIFSDFRMPSGRRSATKR